MCIARIDTGQLDQSSDHEFGNPDSIPSRGTDVSLRLDVQARYHIFIFPKYLW